MYHLATIHPPIDWEKIGRVQVKIQSGELETTEVIDETAKRIAEAFNQEPVAIFGPGGDFTKSWPSK